MIFKTQHYFIFGIANEDYRRICGTKGDTRVIEATHHTGAQCIELKKKKKQRILWFIHYISNKRMTNTVSQIEVKIQLVS